MAIDKLSGVNGGIFWNYNDPSTSHGLALELAGTETQTPAYFLASFNPVHVGAALWTFIDTLHAQFGTFALLLAAGGFVVAWRRDWRTTLVVSLACTAASRFRWMSRRAATAVIPPSILIAIGFAKRLMM